MESKEGRDDFSGCWLSSAAAFYVSLWNNVSSQNNMKPIIDPEET
jgi:hypothetical protein